MRQLVMVIASFLCTSIAALPAQAHDWSAQECREVADFLKNAALSRDYGMSADEFLGRMRSDFELVRAFPPALRWIVADAADETMLLDAASQVFYVPQAPAEHESEFLEGCMQRFALR
jgi:pilus assembly protein TadC